MPNPEQWIEAMNIIRQVRQDEEKMAEAAARLQSMLAIAKLANRTTFRPGEVATLLGVSTTTVYRMIGSGELASLRSRGSLRVDYRGLLNFIREQTT